MDHPKVEMMEIPPLSQAIIEHCILLDEIRDRMIEITIGRRAQPAPAQQSQQQVAA